jgi:beta-alanine degradation protein BauB
MKKSNEGTITRRELLALLAALTASAAQDARARAPRTLPAPDPVKLNPRSYRVAFENDKVRVLEYRSKPGLGVCGQGLHYHPEHLTLGLTAGKLRARGEHGAFHFVEAKAGAIFWAPAEVHEVENLSGRDMHAYMVEYKSPAWKPSTG